MDDNYKQPCDKDLETPGDEEEEEEEEEERPLLILGPSGTDLRIPES